MKTPTWRFTLKSALVAIAVVALIAARLRYFLPEPPASPIPEGAKLHVPVAASFVMQVGVLRDGPPPWPDGNCFNLLPAPRRARGALSLGKPVINMHHENFKEVVTRLRMTTVEVEHFGGCFLVVDPRIPRRWLRERPCPCTLDAVGDAFLSKHVDRFREPAGSQ